MTRSYDIEDVDIYPTSDELYEVSKLARQVLVKRLEQLRDNTKDPSVQFDITLALIALKVHASQRDATTWAWIEVVIESLENA